MDHVEDLPIVMLGKTLNCRAGTSRAGFFTAALGTSILLAVLFALLAREGPLASFALAQDGDATILGGAGAAPTDADSADKVAENGQKHAIDMSTSVTNEKMGFRKFLFGWLLPENALFTGINGEITTNASRDGFNEALVSVRWVPDGACPHAGEVYDTLDEVRVRYPHTRRLTQYIIKKPAKGGVTIPVNFTLPEGMPVSHCVYLIFEGAILTGGSYTMRTNLTLHYIEGRPSSKPIQNQILGDEFCWGMERGCVQWHTMNNFSSFANYTQPTLAKTELVALHGDESASVLLPTALPSSSPRGLEWRNIGGEAPAGAWSVTNDVFVIPDCSATPHAPAGPGDFYETLPAGTVRIFTSTLKGEGIEVRQQPVKRDFSNVIIPKGGCLAHLTKRTGTGALNTEFQVMAFIRELTP
jgi:hypothetical protein